MSELARLLESARHVGAQQVGLAKDQRVDFRCQRVGLRRHEHARAGAPHLVLVKEGVIGATSQQYPVKMAELGVEAIAKFEATGEKPQVTPGLDFYDTGVALVTDKPVEGLESIDVAEGEKLCWGK